MCDSTSPESDSEKAVLCLYCGVLPRVPCLFSFCGCKFNIYASIVNKTISEHGQARRKATGLSVPSPAAHNPSHFGLSTSIPCPLRNFTTSTRPAFYDFESSHKEFYRSRNFGRHRDAKSCTKHQTPVCASRVSVVKRFCCPEHVAFICATKGLVCTNELTAFNILA